MKFVLTALILASPAFAGEFAPVSHGAADGNVAFDSEPAVGISELPSLTRRPVTVPPIAPAPKPLDTRALIRAAAKKHRVPAAFVRSIAAAESNFDVEAVSPKGAIGLMQLMPATAQLLGADPSVPEQNIDAGARYLRFLIDRYRKYKNWLVRVIAAYNAGPAVVDRYRGVPPYPETRAYVARVKRYMKQYKRQESRVAMRSVEAGD